MKNDEQCHLDEDGYYSDSVIYDYPTIAQIYRLLSEYKVRCRFDLYVINKKIRESTLATTDL